MYDIYYAHHQWKYNTPEEAYELALIQRYFPNAKIFNPAVDLKHTAADGEEAVMEECLETVRNSGVVIFSSLDGCVGTGVYHELHEAKRNNKLVFYIYQDSLTTGFWLQERADGGKTDRMFAFVNNLVDINW